jgi:hypothetical protein
MTKEAYYKIGILIMALCAITWMFMSNSWGAESNPKSNPSVYITKKGGALWKTEPAAGMKSKAQLFAATSAVETPMRLFTEK